MAKATPKSKKGENGQVNISQSRSGEASPYRLAIDRSSDIVLNDFLSPSKFGGRKAVFFSRQSGFSLVELVVVLLIITVLSTVAIRSSIDIAYSARHEQTRQRRDSIRQAIVGNPNRSVNGQPDISGFVADMGRLPDNLRELLQRYDCVNPAGASPKNCITPAVPEWADNPGVSVDPGSLLRYGWNGPYLTVSDNPSNSDTYTDGWGREIESYCTTSEVTDANACPDISQSDWLTPSAGFNNYGWYFNQLTPGNLTVSSYGRDHIFSPGIDCGDDGYNGDCSLFINNTDYSISFNTLVVVFRKPLNKNAITLPPVSFCADGSANPPTGTKAACATTWYGDCDNSGFLSNAACTGAGHNWYQCNLNTTADNDTGYASCAQPACYKSKVECEKANGIWFDAPHEIITNRASVAYSQKNICLKVIYRDGSSPGFIASDATDTVNNASPIQVNEDGGIQSLTFTFDSDHANTDFQDVQIPLGINAVGVYEYDGSSCATSNTLYPNDRTTPIPVQFVPHMSLPVINW